MFAKQKRLCPLILTPNARLAEGAVSSKAVTPNVRGLTCSPTRTPIAGQAEEAVSSHWLSATTTFACGTFN